ncbi:chromatin assembly factor 1 subunit A-domain-containing protein [Cryomyces antarcticus]
MADILPSLSVPNPRKRLSPDADTSNDSPCTAPAPAERTNTSDSPSGPTQITDDTAPTDRKIHEVARPSSPTPSSSGSALTEPPRSLHSGPPGATPTKGAPPAKRRKLTTQEKQAKEKEKADYKAKRDDEKRIRDEERRRKNEEKEAKVREKELEKQRKEEERVKKERSQLKLGAFFMKPQQSLKGPESPSASCDTGRRKSLSLEPGEAMVEVALRPTSPQKRNPAPFQSDYERTFLSFALPSYTTVAPYDSLVRSTGEVEAAQLERDSLLSDRTEREEDAILGGLEVTTLRYHFPRDKNTTRGVWEPAAKDIISQLSGSPRNPIDLTNSESNLSQQRPIDLLRAVTVRQLQFAEDVRPPYFGTYTKTRSMRDLSQVGRNPFRRIRPDTDYDYDSEAEWEEPEEGEDLDSEGEEDAESVGSADDMEGFLDDEEATDGLKSKKRLTTRDLEPISTGLCWEDASGKSIQAHDRSAESLIDFEELRMGYLVDVSQTSIDPISTSYWEKDFATAAKTNQAPIAWMPPTVSPDGLMLPPRPPLHARPNGSNDLNIIGAAKGMKGPITSIAAVSGTANTVKAPPKRLMAAEDLSEFKEAIQGSDLQKGELLRALKLRFPKTPQAVLKDTLGTYAARIGVKEADKRWVFVDS